MAQHLCFSELPKVDTESAAWVRAWPQFPVDGCKFFTFIDKTWLYSTTKAWNETYQYNRDSVFQHHWLYSESLVIQGCHRTWQSHFQTPPKKWKTAWDFSNQDPNPALSSDINLLVDLTGTVFTLCYEGWPSKEKPSSIIAALHLPW